MIPDIIKYVITRLTLISNTELPLCCAWHNCHNHYQDHDQDNQENHNQDNPDQDNHNQDN